MGLGQNLGWEMGFISLPLSGKKKLDTDHYYFCPHLLDWEFAVYFGLVLFTATMGFGCHPIIELIVDYGTLPRTFLLQSRQSFCFLVTHTSLSHISLPK